MKSCLTAHIFVPSLQGKNLIYSATLLASVVLRKKTVNSIKCGWIKLFRECLSLFRILWRASIDTPFANVSVEVPHVLRSFDADHLIAAIIAIRLLTDRVGLSNCHVVVVPVSPVIDPFSKGADTAWELTYQTSKRWWNTSSGPSLGGMWGTGSRWWITRYEYRNWNYHHFSVAP